jgi:hypothetical protein
VQAADVVRNWFIGGDEKRLVVIIAIDSERVDSHNVSDARLTTVADGFQYICK